MDVIRRNRKTDEIQEPIPPENLKNALNFYLTKEEVKLKVLSR